MFEGGAQGVGNEAERVQKIAFSRAIRSHEKRQRTKCDIARGEALEVLKGDPRQES
jgi:hypothetical protein